MGGSDLARQDKPLGVDEPAPLAALCALAAVVAPHAARPWVVRALWLSMTPAEASGARPH